MGINIGAFYAPSAASYMRSQFGWEYAFLIASAGMLVGLIIFLINRKKIKEADRTNKGVSEFVMQEPEPQDNKNRIIALSALFGIVILFWMAFHQNGYTLTFWARDCTMTNLKPELFQKANPFFVVLFTPLLIWFWSLLAGAKKEPSTPAKMGIGMLLTALSFLIMYLGAIKLSAMGEGGKVGVSWLLSAYAIVTMGELCLSPMGLSFVSKVAPPKIKGLMMGGWFAATAIGNYLSGYLGSFWEKISHKDFFLLLVISSLFGAVLLFMVMNLLIKALKGGNVAITGDVSGHHVTLSPEPPEEDNEIIKK
jgi:POT family proton-dependent oligopeptide transporter